MTTLIMAAKETIEYVDTKKFKMKAFERCDLCFTVVFGLQILNLDSVINCKTIKSKLN